MTHDELTPTALWLMLLLCAYHGLNPGMGWLFAVALGMQEQKGSAVAKSLVPIALGHALAIGSVVLSWNTNPRPSPTTKDNATGTQKLKRKRAGWELLFLVPREGALAMLKAGCPVERIAFHFAVSDTLCRWRIRQSGIDKQAERWLRYWRK